MRLRILLTLATILVVVVGCSGGGGMPVVPEYPEGDITSLEGATDLPTAIMPDAGHLLWGYWQGTFDLPTNQVEIVRLRQAEFHANLAGILKTKPLGLSYEVKGFNLLKGTASVDVTLTHPYPNTNFRGFDTRGIFMGPGATLNSNNDPSLVYPAPTGCRITNADGYTRWWNATEFTTSGMYGYDDDNIIPGFLIPTTTLNPYKYFADCLGPDDPIITNVDLTNRGTFSTDNNPPSLTRNYKIQFPKSGGQSKYSFHYAVDVSWAPPNGNSPVPKPIGDFPINANCREAFHINVDTEGTTAWYKNATERGGEIKLTVEVFDWQASTNPFGIEGEIESIWLESKTLFDSIYEGQLSADPGSQETSGIFHFTIPNVTPTSLDNQEILITIRSENPDSYAPPVYGPKYPLGARLSAYALVDIPISGTETHTIHVKSPNGYELLMAGSSHKIEWETSPYAEIGNVSILLSTDSGQKYDKGVAYSITNTGSYIFYNIPEAYIGTQNRIMVLDAANPSTYDESDADFKILPKLVDQIIVAVPNGGEEWIAGTSKEIKWLGDPNITNVTIKFSKDSGQTWPVTIIDSVPNADGKYTWGPIPQEYISPDCRIGVFDAGSPSIFDISDADFAIVEPGIELDSPVMGDIWEDGNEVEITWSASNIITGIDILLSLDSGDTYPITIADNTSNDGVLEWEVDDPGISQTTQARVKIQDHDNPSVYFDESGDFTILMKSMTLTYPNGGEEWRIGFPQTIEWLWTGNIPLVDIKMSLDGGMTFDNYIIQNEPNTGSFDIAIFDAAWLSDYTKWDFTEKEAKIRIEASGTPSLNSLSAGVFTIPITLGIINGKNSAASGDADGDNVKNSIETMLGMNTETNDSDRDGMYDFNELFKMTSFNDYDTLPDEDCDGEYAPSDYDDDDDGVNDGRNVDSDLDGIPNYLEYYGYTYNWMTGDFLEWDDKWDEGIPPDYTLDYHKTDPLQPSTDQDPYSDGMETSGLLMDQSVVKPGNSPMVPACPNIIVRLMGYKVTLNADITDSKGGSESKGKSWDRETQQSNTSSSEHHWGIEVGVEHDFSLTGGTKVSVKASAGGSYSSSNTTSTSNAVGESVTETWDWSTARSTNPTSAAAVKLFLKVYNMGTACASNIIPTITLMVGRHPIATFEPGNSQINLLPPNGSYPAGEGVYWVVDSIDTGAGVAPIYLTLDELKAFESGAPISVEMTQMLADVAAMNEQGYWEYVGDWNEYMTRVDAVCADIYIDAGDGNPINYRIYADDDPSAPEVTLGDAFIWAVGARDEGGKLLVDYKLADGSLTTLDLADCRFMYDQKTWNTIQENMTGNEFRLIDIPLTPNAVIIGKAKPIPPLDKPKIHWAGYDGAYNTVYACATDYYAISKVEFWEKTPDVKTPLTYDNIIGCYILEMPEGFELVPGNEYEIIATNTEGITSTFVVEEMDDLPGGSVESYPEISDISFAITESLSRLDTVVSAKVEDDYYAISEVYLLDSLENVIGQMEYDSISDKYVYSAEIEPDYQPSGAEKIRAYNTSDYMTTSPIPASAYSYPAQIYAEGTFVWPDWGNTYMFDFESPGLYQPSFTQETDLFFYIIMPFPTELRLWLGHSTIQSYITYIGLNTPVSRDFMMSLYEGGGFTGKGQYNWDWYSGNALLMMLTTTHQRLAYIYTYYNDGTNNEIYRVYSLYNGPWD